MPVDDTPKPDPLAKTKKQIRFYLSNLHELGQMFIAPSRTDDSGGGGGSFESGAWWETLACMRCDVQRAMEGLTARQKEAVGLVYGVGFTIEEAAHLMELAEISLKQLLARGVQAMAEAVGEAW